MKNVLKILYKNVKDFLNGKVIIVIAVKGFNGRIKIAHLYLLTVALKILNIKIILVFVIITTNYMRMNVFLISKIVLLFLKKLKISVNVIKDMK